MFPIPHRFRRTIMELYDDEGVHWLEGLPRLLEAAAQRWSLTLLPPFELSYNYVVPAVQSDGAAVVLKVGKVNPELLTEIAALQFYDGRGIVRLLDADAERGLLLLERLLPGITLVDLNNDEQAAAIAAQLMRLLWRPAPTEQTFPTVSEWAAGLRRLRDHYDGGVGPFPRRMVEMAETLFAELIPSMAEPVLLHGDLHHWNILSAGRQPWLALDPKGLVGEPAYEIGAFLRNPSPQTRQVQARRVDQFSNELGLDRQRIIRWGVAQAVLSAWWSVEDHGYGWEPAIQCAEILSQLPLRK